MQFKPQWRCGAGLIGCFFFGAILSGAAKAQEPATASQWTALFQNQSNTVWDGGDQAISYLAGNGVTYWCFGDTIQGTNSPNGALNPGWTMVGNKVLIEQNGVFRTATTASPSVPNDTAGNRYWDDAMFEANGFLYVLAQKVQGSTANCIGTQLAKFSMQADGSLAFAGMVSTPATGVSGGVGPAANQFSSDAFAADGYIYFFGSTGTTDKYNPAITDVARVPTAQVENSAAWQFWNGSSWATGSMAQCAPILNDGITSAMRIGGRWVLLHKPFGPYGVDVYAEVGLSPTGPWAQTDIFQSPGVSGQPNGQNYGTYYPEIHPDKALGSGNILVSISWNGNSLFNDVALNASLYKPRFYEVSLPNVLSTGVIHELAPQCAPQTRLEEYGTSQVSGTKTDIWAANHNSNQKWQLNWVGPDLWALVPQSAAGLRLDNSASRAVNPTVNGSAADVFGSNDSQSQRWYIGDQGNGYYVLSPSDAPSKALDVDGGSSINGTRVQLWDFFPGWNEQLWQIR